MLLTCGAANIRHIIAPVSWEVLTYVTGVVTYVGCVVVVVVAAVVVVGVDIL